MNEWLSERLSRLRLEAHPEGGHFREVYRSSSTLPLPRGQRSLLTSIHFLLAPGEVSRWHRVRADEAWCFYEGAPVDLYLLDDAGHLAHHRLGPSPGGEALAVVPAGYWQAAECRGQPGSHVTCTVAPGFDFGDFRLASPGELAGLCPEHESLVRRLGG
ncbi:MAG: cupin domain-containing protein [Deltaproteobacteria bacterium]|nr:cupin domain-containing protein [Deltaproteobacteria bacterium]